MEYLLICYDVRVDCHPASAMNIIMVNCAHTCQVGTCAIVYTGCLCLCCVYMICTVSIDSTVSVLRCMYVCIYMSTFSDCNWW